MFKIEESEISVIIHDLIKVVGTLKKIENGTLTKKQHQLLHGCEIKLIKIRTYILESIKENGKVNKGGEVNELEFNT